MNIDEKARMVLDQIAQAARSGSEMAQFGKEVAEILLENKEIDQAVFAVLTGK